MLAILVTQGVGKKMGKMVTFRVFSLRHLVFSETFQSEVYLVQTDLPIKCTVYYRLF